VKAWLGGRGVLPLKRRGLGGGVGRERGNTRREEGASDSLKGGGEGDCDPVRRRAEKEGRRERGDSCLVRVVEWDVLGLLDTGRKGK